MGFGPGDRAFVLGWVQRHEGSVDLAVFWARGLSVAIPSLDLARARLVLHPDVPCAFLACYE